MKFLPEKEQDGFLMDFYVKKPEKPKPLVLVVSSPLLSLSTKITKTKVECLKYTLPISFVVPREILPLVKSIRLDRLR